MTFKVTKASDWFEDEPRKITFNSLEELKDFQVKCKHSLVINFEIMTIIIYDDYLE